MIDFLLNPCRVLLGFSWTQYETSRVLLMLTKDDDEC